MKQINNRLFPNDKLFIIFNYLIINFFLNNYRIFLFIAIFSIILLNACRYYYQDIVYECETQRGTVKNVLLIL